MPEARPVSYAAYTCNTVESIMVSALFAFGLIDLLLFLKKPMINMNL